MDRGEFPHLTEFQFESIRKMAGIIGGDIFRSLAAATPTKQNARMSEGLQAPVAEVKPAQPKPLRLKVNSYEGNEGENLHFWVREVELAMDAALISTERRRVAFSLSNLGGRERPGRTRARRQRRVVSQPGLSCVITFFQATTSIASARASLPVNKGSVSCTNTSRRLLAASLVGNPLPEHIKVTVFMDGLKVGPSRTQLFRVHANTMEEAIQIAL
ncbi:LOW QUALITY PROTEIN: Gag protein [Phytophthora palmivora]|uniref:Gag protein n=1 Tax=Phytophthora palmivora TaxID=4796 RepID=A0A2P4X363_9STRA|nr:LOW QUALITY PROTEIN: Gag protein [Phytophthora palmivora]